jgi:hypothetical protein
MLLAVRAKREMQATAHTACVYHPADKTRAKNVLDTLLAIAANLPKQPAAEISSIRQHIAISEEV